MAEPDVVKYNFGPLERRGLVGMLRPGQSALVVGTTAACMGAIRLLPGFMGAFVAVGLAAAGYVVGFVPVAGRTVEEWAGPWLRHRWAVATGRNVEVALGEAVGFRAADGAGAAAPPTPAAEVEIMSFVHEGRRVGVAHDARAGAYTATMRTTGPTFMLKDPGEHTAILAQWGQVLASLATNAAAGTGLSRLQVLEVTRPDTGHEMRQYFEEVRDPDVADEAEMVRSYEALLTEASPASQVHEVLLVLRVSGPRAGGIGVGRIAAVGAAALSAVVLGAAGAIAAAVVVAVAAVAAGFFFMAKAMSAQMAGDRESCERLGREMSSMTRALRGWGVSATPLGPREYAGVIRSTYDPESGEARRDLEDDPGPSTPNAWPLSTRAEWASYETDSGLHCTMRVREFPRRPVHADFLHPLVFDLSSRRCLSMVYEAVPPHRAQVEAERAVSSDEAAARLSEQRGFRVTAKRHRQMSTAQEREDELAAGHGLMRYACYLTVTVAHGDHDGLREAVREARQAAAAALMDLSPEYGNQDRAFTYCLPLGRGL